MRGLRKISLALALVLVISCIPVYAISDSVTLQLYRTVPASLSVQEGETEKIGSVEKYTFTYKGKETFSSITRFMKNLKGQTILPLSVKWVSSNEKVATVNTYGKVTGIKKGTAYVYPVPKGVYEYRLRGKYITYSRGNILSDIKIFGGTAVKVKVTR